jgi:hypothetical protein
MVTNEKEVISSFQAKELKLTSWLSKHLFSLGSALNWAFLKGFNNQRVLITSFPGKGSARDPC